MTEGTSFESAVTLLADMLALEGVKDGRAVAVRYLTEIGFSPDDPMLSAQRRLAWIREYVALALKESNVTRGVLNQVLHMATPVRSADIQTGEDAQS